MKAQSQIYKNKINFDWNPNVKYDNLQDCRVTETLRQYNSFNL